MDRVRGIRLALVVAALVASWAGTSGTAAADEADALFNPATVWVVHLTLPQSSIEGLEGEPDEYVPGQFSIAATGGTPQTEGPPSTPVAVEVRLKGSTSFEDLDGKAAFKLKFPKASRPSAFGLKKMTLNNMVQDPSMVHETLAYELFRAAGVPASRTGYAYVYLNGQDYGMHLNLETLDDQALERIFAVPFDSGTQHLYEGEDGADVVPGAVAKFQVDEGDEESTADLAALVAAAGSAGPAPWSQRVAPYADLGEMTRMWSVEKFIGHWDGYSGVRETANQPNNFYLYSTPQGLFQMLPWGTDETFQPDRHIAFDGVGSGALFEMCIADEACATAYWHSLTATLTAARGLDLAPRAAALDALLAPWQQLEQKDGRGPYPRSVAHAAALSAGEFATRRVGEAEAWLAVHAPPEEPGDGPGGPGAPKGSNPDRGSAGGSPAGAAPSDEAPAPRLRQLRSSREALRSLLSLSGDAIVSQRATFASADGRRTACAIRPRRHQAGELMLECHLRRAARERLQSARLALRVTTTVKSASGTTTFRRKITLPAA